MANKERMGRMRVPRWWLEKALPMLASAASKDAEIARAASLYAGRHSPWGPSAISKFKSGTGRTVELTNGISAALQIPPPFFIAPTERAAGEMLQIAKRERAHAVDGDRKLSVVDGVFVKEIDEALVDSAHKQGVASADDGNSSGRGVRTRRAVRRRS